MKLKVKDRADAQMDMLNIQKAGFRIGGIFDIVCKDKDGNIKWQEKIHNLVN